jgi:hypothetical protein
VSQKGGVLEGALLTEEVFESTDSLLDTNRAGGTKGAQQYYSPYELSVLAKSVLGSTIPVLDPTAGDGSLLEAFDPGYSFGIEIDADQVNAAEGSYKAIKGDLQHVYPLLRMASPEFPAIVANPPFNLKWSDPAFEEGNEISSTLLAFLYSIRLLTHDGQFVFVCGTDRFKREIVGRDEATGIYAAIECNDLFEDVVLPCVVAFGVHPNLRPSEGIVWREFDRSQLDLAATWVANERQAALGYARYARRGYSHEYENAWPAIQKEYEQRLKERLDEKYSRKYDIELEGKILNVILSPYAQITSGKTGNAHTLKGLHRKNVNYFQVNTAEWRNVKNAVEDGTVTIDPAAVEAIEKVMLNHHRNTAPNYAIRDIQRLGWLDEIDRIECTHTDTERGFYAGEKYAITTKPSTYYTTEKRYEQSKKTGEWTERRYEQMRKRLEISIKAGSKYHKFYDDDNSSHDLVYLTSHFKIPEVPDIAERFPEEVHAMRMLLWEIIWDTIVPNSAKNDAANDPAILDALEKGELELVFTDADGFTHTKPIGVTLRKFQIEDIARMLVKGSGFLAWEQGLGKTLGALIYTEAMRRLGSQDAALFIVPGDLVKQWQRETKRFFDRELELIANRDIQIPNPDYGKVKRARRTKKHTIPVQAIASDIARHVKGGGEGWYVTYYEALTQVGTQRVGWKNGKKALDPVIVKEITVPGDWVHGRWEYNPETQRDEYKEGYQDADRTKQLDSTEICPSCHTDNRRGWNGETCEKCGYAHIELRIKPASSWLTTCFRKGTIVVDELTMIQGDSKRSEAIRGLRAKNRLGMTGTPVKNYIHQAFWLLWWTLGNASTRFPYDYDGGRTQFAKDFCVWEWNVTFGTKQGGRAKADVTNLAMLWKLLASSVIRRRMEETGEEIVDTRYHEHEVPLGVAQRAQMAKWLKWFWKFFEEKYPDKKVVKSGAHKVLAPMLGLQPKLEYAATLPLADKEYDWFPSEEDAPGIDWSWLEAVSNYTPGNYRTLELAMALAKEGRKVLVGSSTKETGRWLADRLNEKGVIAEHILDESGTTANKDVRAEVVHSFQTSDTQVFCAGIQAIRLGHNLDAGSAIIINGMPWDWESFDQFVKRVRRLTSTRDIDVHLVIPKSSVTETLTAKKWELLQAKGQAADLALDGRLIEKDVEEIKAQDVLTQMIEKGLEASGEEIAESNVEQNWTDFPTFADYTPPRGVTTGYSHKLRSFSPWEAWTAILGDHTRSQLALPMKACETISQEDREIARMLRGDTITINGEIATVTPDVPETWEDDFIEPEDREEENDEDEPFADCEMCGTEITVGEHNRTATTEWCESCGEPEEEADEEEEPIDTNSSDLPPIAITTSKTELTQAIRDLKELLDIEALTPEEFAEAKADLLLQLRKAA